MEAAVDEFVTMAKGTTLVRGVGRRNMVWPTISRACCCSYADVSSKFQLGSYWASVSAAINMALHNAIPVGYPEKIHASMRYSVFSPAPKLPCGMLCTAACEVAGGLRTTALPAACAVEMVQAASLAHDHLPSMANVALHAGHTTNHVVYGDDVAILAGDALFALAFQHMAECTQGVPEKRLRVALSELANRMGSMGHVAGRYMDLVGQRSGTMDGALLEYIYLRKAALMAEMSVVCGAVIGGGGEDEVETLRGYGRAVGMMWQMKEEMLEGERGGERVSYATLHGMGECQSAVAELHSTALHLLNPFSLPTKAPLSAFAHYAATRSF